jgi:Tfp pilus assembly protein PilP
MTRIAIQQAWARYRLPAGVCALLLVALSLGPLAAAAQEADEPGAQEPESAAIAPAETGASGGEDRQDIDELLRGESDVLAGEGYSYDPESRRDPFKSLLVATQVSELRGPRPEGIPGLLIDEVMVTGIFRTQQGYVAQVQSAENEKSFLLKEGDQLYDGDVVRITDGEIVFKQIVQDPTALKPFREVVKTLSADQQ